MKKNYFIISALFILTSCSKQDFLEILTDKDILPVTRTYGGDGEDDVLGYSCDISSDYLCSKLPVIDNKKQKKNTIML